MMNRLVQRTLSLSLAAILTLGMLGGIDQLTVNETPAAGWAAQQTSTTRA